MGATIYHMPGACSRVALIALEAAGEDYEDRTVALLAGAQREPLFQAVNPKGKVPVLLFDNQTITELPVILYELANRNPEAGLMPTTSNGTPELSAVSDIVWLAGALHPAASRIFRPSAFAPNCAEEVKRTAIVHFSDLARLVTRRLQGDWFYGETWSIADSFAAWVFNVAMRSGFALDDFPVIAAHLARVEATSTFKRAVERERVAVARDNVALPPGFEL